VSDEVKIAGKASEEGQHHHGGKFTEGLLDNKLILKALNIKPGQTILDAGCGNGYMSKLFSNEVSLSGKIYAIDPDKHFIKILMNEIKGTNIEAMAGDISGPTQLCKSSIDLIYVSAVIHAFSKSQITGFLHEVKRLLKPGGVLAIVEIEKKETPFGPPLNRRFSPEELKGMVPMAPLNTIQAGEHFYMQMFENIEKQVD